MGPDQPSDLEKTAEKITITLVHVEPPPYYLEGRTEPYIPSASFAGGRASWAPEGPAPAPVKDDGARKQYPSVSNEVWWL